MRLGNPLQVEATPGALPEAGSIDLPGRSTPVIVYRVQLDH